MANRERDNRRRPRELSPKIQTNRQGRSRNAGMRIEPQTKKQRTRKERKQEPQLHRFEGREQKRQEQAQRELRKEQRKQRAIAQQVVRERMQTPEERVQKSMRQAAEKKQKRRTLILRIFLILLGIALLGTLVYVLLRVGDIQVDGNQWLEDSYVIELSGIRMGDNILQLNEAQIQERIEDDPHFVFEDMKYRFPTGIVLVVTERMEAACFEFANTYVKVDPDGLILGHADKAEGTDLPIVKGLEVTEFVLGAEIRTTDTYKQNVLREVLNALCQKEMQQMMASIDMSNVNQIWMQLKEGMDVCIGQATDLEAKFVWLDEILQTIRAEGYTGGTIDLTSTLAPVYIPPDAEPGSTQPTEK